MEVSRVIKDSDDEDDSLAGDPPSITPLGNRSAQGVFDNDTGYLHAVNHTQSQNSASAQAEVDFDQFIQTPETLRPQLSSSQQRREERWIPSEGLGAEGSIGEKCNTLGLTRPEIDRADTGSVVTAIGLPQRQLIDDDAFSLVPTASYTEPIPARLQHQVDGLYVGQETVGAATDGFEYGGDLDNGLNRANMLPAADDHTLQTENDPGRRTADSAKNSLSCDSYEPSSTSYFIFESSKPSTDTPAGNSVAADGESEQTPYKSPHRSKSMQLISCSPHDTEPFSSMVSPKLSRARSDNEWTHSHSSARSTGDGSSGAIIEDVQKKKRDRKRKRTLEILVEHPYSHGHEASDQNTNPDRRKPDQPPSKAKRNNRTHSIHTDLPTLTVEIEVKQQLESNGAGVSTNGSQDGTTKDDGMQSTEADIPKSPERSSHLPDKETVFAKPAKPAAKGPKKKKLKRGKTTSLTLHKTHEFDIEEDVIWIDDKPTNPDVYEPEAPSVCDNAGNIEALKPASGAEESPTVKSHNAADALPEPAGPKKRGRKRKKTSEQIVQEGSTSVQENPAQIQEEPSTNADDTTNEEKHPNIETEINPEIIPALDDSSIVPPAPQPITEPECEAEKENPPPVTPQKPSKNSDSPANQNKGPSKHSPIAATSKVPYRVGLSRRARIAPLLRVVRR